MTTMHYGNQPYYYHDPCPYNWDELKKKIWDYQWMISTKRKWTFSDWDYEHRGITITGDPFHDVGSMDTWTNVTRSIADLVDFYDDGKEFILRNPPDAKRIFEYIQEYTQYVAWKFEHSIHMLNYDVENNKDLQEVIRDVVKMQNFGNRIFPLAMANYKFEPITTGLFGWVSKRSGTGIIPKIEFNPSSYFGISVEKFKDVENVDKETGYFNAIDLRSGFDPSSLNKIKGYMNHV